VRKISEAAMSPLRTLVPALVLPALSLVGCAGQIDTDPQVQTVSQGLVSADRVLADYVATPHGYYHQSCVHELPDGAELDVDGRVTLADGTAQQLPACNYPRLIVRPNAAAQDETDGWVEYSSFTSATPATRLASRMTVPAAPSSAAGQVVFFFPGMEPADGTIILQPVLQWGESAAGGGDSWEMASWSCGPSCVHSKLAKTATGDTLIGDITGSSCTSSGQCSWKIVTEDSTTGKSTTLTTHGDTESYVWLFGGVLEAYGITACNQYPTTGKETFSAVDFYDVNGNYLSASYTGTQTGVSPSCNFKVTPSTSGAVLNF
jgi:hypothetical protein